MVTAPNRSSTVVPTVRTRCPAMPLRASGGIDWLSARSRSSRSGAVYCVPVSPVRGSTVSAEVRPRNLSDTVATCSVIESSKRARALPSASPGSGWPSDGGKAAVSATTAVSGRGTVSPEWMEVARVERMAVASSGVRSQTSGGTRIWVRGSALGRSPRHSIDASASWRRATAESCRSGTSSESSRYDGAIGVRPAPASAAPTIGSNGAVTT